MGENERKRKMSIDIIYESAKIDTPPFRIIRQKALSMTFEPRAVTSPCVITRILLSFFQQYGKYR